MSETAPKKSAKPEATKFASRLVLHSIVCPPQKPSIEVWHETEPGFGARIMRQSKRTGKTLRTYLYRHDVDGKDTKAPLGTFEELSYDTAKEAAQDKRRARTNTLAVKQVPTLREALEKYLENRSDRLSDATVTDYTAKWKLLDGDVTTRKPGAKLFTETTLMTELDGEWWLAKFKSTVLRHGRASALGLYRTARALYQHFMERDYVPRNPLIFVGASIDTRKKAPSHVIIPAAKLPALWLWMLTEAQPATRDFLIVALLSGLRTSVIGQLRWAQVRPETRTYIVPAEERGNKAKTLIELPVGDELWERVFAPRLAARREGQEWVIASSKKPGRPAVSVRSALEGLSTVTGIKCSPHILRKTFATLAQLATGNHLLASRMLSHTTKIAVEGAPAVSGGYIHYEEDDLRQGFNLAAKFILERCVLQKPASTS